MLKAHSPIVVTYSIIVNIFCELGDLRMGYFALTDMQFLGISPNLVTFTCLIDGYSKNDRLNMALDLYDRMTNLSMLPNVFTFNALDDALCKKGMLERAVEMFEKMHEIGVPANAVVYTSLIDTGDVKKGLDLHKEMLIKGFELDPFTTSAGFASMGFCRRQKEGDMVEALRLERLMVQKGIYPDLLNFSSLICGSATKGFMMEAKQDLFMDGQCPEYSADEQAICAVGLAKSKSGIFVEAIHYLLVLATPVESILEGDDAGAEGAMGINKTEEVVEEVVDLGKLTMKGPGLGEGEGDRQWQR
ncbi:unnamed protein product [Musa hybrid cultivar]